jgi:programmed cell death protein 5
LSVGFEGVCKAFCVLLDVLEINIFSGHILACWMSAEDEELERLRQQRMAELQSRAAEEQARRQREMERAAVMRMVLTPEARQRLNNLKLIKPELAERVETYLIQAVQTGNIRLPIGDEELKALLDRLLPKKRETKIEWRSRGGEW